MLRSFLVSLGLVAFGVPCLLVGCVVESTSGPPTSSSSGGGSGSGSGGSSSGASSSGSSSGSSGGVCMALTSVPTGDVPAYAPVQQKLNACTAAQIASFVSACIEPTSQTACQTFQGDASNVGCLSCLIPVDANMNPTNAGGMLLDASGTTFIASNLPGCVALTDKSDGGGATCAQALEPYLQCTAYACSTCTTATDFNACVTAATATGAPCASEDTATQSACTTDFADAGVGNTTCGTDTSTIDVICGTGTGAM